jgi:hypothetical protein
MRARIGGDFFQLVDDVLGRRQVRIAHAEIDDIAPRLAAGGLHPVHFREHIRRQAPLPVKHFRRGRGHGRVRLLRCHNDAQHSASTPRPSMAQSGGGYSSLARNTPLTGAWR